MTQPEFNVAEALIAMPDSEIADFVKSSVQRRRLRTVVSQLNREALSKKHPEAYMAEKALKKLGFTD